jgi:hypothetical protein
MVRSLIIRQAFRVFDITLTLAVTAVVLVVIRMFLAPLPALDADLSLDDASDVELTAVLKTVGDRHAYDSLVKGGLFGNASDWDPGAAPVEEEPVEEEIPDEIEESDLGLALRGTVALESGKDFAAALIENTEKREKPHPYKIDQEVLEDIVLIDIAQREVILLNKRQSPPRKERLSMGGGELQLTGGSRGSNANQSGAATTAQAGASAGEEEELPFSRGRRGRGRDSERGSSASVQRITLNHNEVIQEVMENFSAINSLRPEVKTDESGQVLGLTLDDIESLPMAQQFGARNGDVLQSINNEEITHPSQIFDIIQRYQSATSFRVGILRDGRPMVLNFQID